MNGSIDEKRKNWKRLRILSLVLSICTIVLGAVMAVWPDVSALAVCYILAILCIAVGVSELVQYFQLGLAGMFFRFDLALGICSIFIGVLLLGHPAGAMAVLPVAVGIYLIMDSVFCIQLSTEMRRLRSRGWWLELVLGLAGVVLALLLLADPFAGAKALMVFMGVSLIVSGVRGLYRLFCIRRAIKENKMDLPRDADWREIP